MIKIYVVIIAVLILSNIFFYLGYRKNQVPLDSIFVELQNLRDRYPEKEVEFSIFDYDYRVSVNLEISNRGDNYKSNFSSYRFKSYREALEKIREM